VDSHAKTIRRVTALLAVVAGLLLPASAGARWTEPFWLATPEQNAYRPVLAVNDRGDALVAWTGPDDSIMVAERFAGGPFGPPHQIGSGRIPLIALNNAGEALVAWTGGTPVGLKLSRRPPGGSFGEPEVVTEPGRRAAYGVSAWDVAVGDNGDAAVVWWDQTSERPEDGSWTKDQVLARWRQADGTFGETQQVTSPRYASDGLDTAIDAHGRLTVAWDGPKPGLPGHWFSFAATGTRTGGFGPIDQLSDGAGCVQPVNGGVTSVKANKRGDALVGWREGTLPFPVDGCDYDGVVVSYRKAGAGFGQSRRLSPEQDLPNGFRPTATGAALAVDEKGNALADWYDGRDAVAYRSVATGQWGPLRRISPEYDLDGNQLDGGTVGLDHTGREVFLWTGTIGEYGPAPVIGTRRQADGDAERTESLAPPRSQNLNPVLGFDKLGGGIAIWSSSDNAGKHTSSYDVPHGIRVSFYDDAPPEVSGLELVEAPAAPPRLSAASAKRALRFKLSERGRVRLTVKRSTSCKRHDNHLACKFKDVASVVRAAKRGRNSVELSQVWLNRVSGAKRARVRVLPRDGIGQRGHAKQLTFQPG
jgi:hypothetical protein